MHTTLKKDLEARSEIMTRALALAERYYSRQDFMPPGKLISDLPMADLPENGIGALAALDYFDMNYSHLVANSAGPRYFGFVTGGSTPASVAADWLVSAYDQNACGSNDSIAPQIERQTIHYFKQMFGLDEGFYGSFVTGATMANFVGLALARQWIGEQHGVDPSSEGLASLPVNVVSGTAHSSILKSLSMLGIGRNALRQIDTLDQREAVDISKLENYLASDPGPVIVVANAGTVNTGDFDDLRAIGMLKKNYRFWLHIDGAFGGFAACSEKHKHLMTGVNFADSITIDAHKWLNVPYDAAMQFTRHRALQLKVFRNNAAYLGDPDKSPDFFHYTPESSRRWRALPSWLGLLAYGREGQKEIVERNCALAAELGERIAGNDLFSLLSPVRLNIVCFTLNRPGLNDALIKGFLDRVRDDGRVFFTPTRYKGVPAIRAAISNWQTEPRDIEITFEIISRLAEKSMVDSASSP